jgi:c(7)-type cytochrome triheme protein
MRLLRRLLAFVFCVLFSISAASAMTIVSPERYGTVVIDNYSGRAGVAPVLFDHWLHRAKFTCRLCHVDVGFAMEAGATKISAATNMKGFHCGACHNGKRAFEGRKIFGSCSDNPTREEGARCERCHSLGKNVKREHEFDKFIKGLPKQVFGNGIDWEQAESRGFIRPADFLEGVSIKREALKMDKDVFIESKGTWMSDVLFSHKKHAVWNGCEVCHPEIFPSTKKGTVRYSMMQISTGEYCGVCHDKVAFPIINCQKCHTRPVH